MEERKWPSALIRPNEGRSGDASTKKKEDSCVGRAHFVWTRAPPDRSASAPRRLSRGKTAHRMQSQKEGHAACLVAVGWEILKRKQAFRDALISPTSHVKGR